MKKTFMSFLLLGAVLLCAATAADEDSALIGSITLVRGMVEIQHGKDQIWEKAEIDMPIYPGDKVKTGTRSEAELILDDGSMLRLEEGTLIEVIESKLEGSGTEGEKKTFFLNLWAGKILNSLKKLFTKESAYKVSTQTAVIGVRGTEFSVEAEEGITGIAVYDGEVDVTSEIDEKKASGVRLKPNQETSVKKGGVPLAPKDLSRKARSYRKTILVKFRKRVDKNRSDLEKIRKRREKKIELMKEKVSDFKKKTQEKLENQTGLPSKQTDN